MSYPEHDQWRTLDHPKYGHVRLGKIGFFQYRVHVYMKDESSTYGRQWYTDYYTFRKALQEWETECTKFMERVSAFERV